MSLRMKLLISFGLILTVWVFSGYYILSHLQQLDRLQSSMPDIDLRKSLIIRAYTENLQALRTRVILHSNMKSVQESERNRQLIRSLQRESSRNLDSLRSLSVLSRQLSESFGLNGFDLFLLESARSAELIDTLLTGDELPFNESDRLVVVSQLQDSLGRELDQYLILLNRGKTGMAGEALVRRINPLYERIRLAVDSYGSQSSFQTAYKLSIIHRMTVQIKILIYIFWTVTLLFILVFIFYYFQKIIRSIRKLKEASYRIARGEFEARIEQRAFSEMDELADSFNTMAEQLQELEKMKSDFFNKLVHDFKSPLDNIKQSADVLLSGIAGGAPDPKQREFLEIIKRSSASLRNFVQDQLDESNLISGQMELKYETTDLRALVTERIQLQKPVATARKIHFSLKYTPTPLMIECDRSKISRVIDNLLNNAIKYSYEQTGVDIELDETETLIECRVKDRGPGIPHTQKERIFQKYVRLQTTVKTPGTGLGLYTARYIVQLHHGTIWVESTPGRGSTFAFSLPKSLKTGKR